MARSFFYLCSEMMEFLDIMLQAIHCPLDLDFLIFHYSWRAKFQSGTILSLARILFSPNLHYVKVLSSSSGSCFTGMKGLVSIGILWGGPLPKCEPHLLSSLHFYFNFCSLRIWIVCNFPPKDSCLNGEEPSVWTLSATTEAEMMAGAAPASFIMIS